MTTLSSPKSPQVIFDFNNNSVLNNWRILDDTVMGGVSSSTFQLTTNGNGVFEGNISLKNNGGFSSVRFNTSKTLVKEYTKVVILLKGDGKDYQFRIRTNAEDSHSYITPFSTTGEWQEIEFTLKEMYPSFRGRKLDQPNFDAAYFEALTFLIGNKKKEYFKLLIDKIELQ
jgi:NADH dehydrogenase [ubiquinone] 1 alpha subcomplex assembly factor 1